MLLAFLDGLLGGSVLDLLLPGGQLGVELVLDDLSGVLDVLGDLILLAVELLGFVPSDQVLQLRLSVLVDEVSELASNVVVCVLGLLANDISGILVDDLHVIAKLLGLVSGLGVELLGVLGGVLVELLGFLRGILVVLLDVAIVLLGVVCDLVSSLLELRGQLDVVGVQVLEFHAGESESEVASGVEVTGLGAITAKSSGDLEGVVGILVHLSDGVVLSVGRGVNVETHC